MVAFWSFGAHTLNMSINRNLLFLEQTRKRVLLSDGGVGTELLKLSLSEEDFRSNRFRNHQNRLLNNLDILNLTQRKKVAQVHRSYLMAGADIISTNTFRSNYEAQLCYGTQDLIYEINRTAGQIARQAVDRFMSESEGNPRFVAGIIGPVGRWDANSSLHLRSQVAGLIDGGVDLLLAESLCHRETTRELVSRLCDILMEYDDPPIVWISFTITEMFDSHRVLSEIDCIKRRLSRLMPLIVGINCISADNIPQDILSKIAEEKQILISCHPSAGEPDNRLNYPIDEVGFQHIMFEFLQKGLLNIVGGCCGTSPRYIQRIAGRISEIDVRMFTG